MTKADLIKAVAEKADLTQKAAARAVDAFIEAVQEAVGKGEDVRIPGFGAFVVKERAERQGRDLRTGEVITIPARKVVAFRAGKELREAVN
ncbi:histone family protein DNA-binding protein [Desulfofundulus kuznetsovii DSM 6115]|uniref:Histone family protein DNA-binding protein n=1 Tax=Desulfofundulus kuznetsovii (strain DSM 6115 / VKM B-1805 / 17) TaxID=760568 RepID=A0AAU8PCQ1_DESK7|nr:histone family protein DNA-binding protein [Desulfofundulus kuznetsovii DSM 6115]